MIDSANDRQIRKPLIYKDSVKYPYELFTKNQVKRHGRRFKRNRKHVQRKLCAEGKGLLDCCGFIWYVLKRQIEKEKDNQLDGSTL